MYPGLVKSTGLVFAEKPSIGIEPTNLPDRSRWGNHGTHTNVTMVRLPSGLWVRSFNGSTSFISLGNSPSLRFPKEFTISAWSNAGAGVSTRLVAKSAYSDTRHNYRLIENSLITCDAAGNLLSHGFTDWRDGNYHNIVAQYDTDGFLKAYLDGSYDSQTDISGVTLATTGGTDQNVNVGRYRYSSTYYYNSREIGLVTLWNYALNPAQIRANFTAERSWFGV